MGEGRRRVGCGRIASAAASYPLPLSLLQMKWSVRNTGHTKPVCKAVTGRDVDVFVWAPGDKDPTQGMRGGGGGSR